MRPICIFYKIKNLIERFVLDYSWTKTSESFYRVIKKRIKKRYRILEFGSDTGHISYRLVREGYDITLMDIREDAIDKAKRKFERNGLKAKFIVGDIFKFNGRFDFAWNSGLIQCFDDYNKAKLIKKISKISPKILLFYPDTEDPNKIRGKNKSSIPGVGDAMEYDIKNVPKIVGRYFRHVDRGIINAKDICLKYNMLWVYGNND